MRDPELIKKVETNGIKEEVLEINSIPKFDTEDYDLFDKKDFNKYMTSIEKIVRGSFEYRTFINFIRENMEMNTCSFIANVSNADNFKIKIEIHHDPITLYDYCLIVYNKRVANNEPLDEELVAKEVMFLHYNLLIGLIPLSQTVHQLVHNNYLFIPLTHIMGKWQEFIKAYDEFIPAEIKDKLDRSIEFTQSYDDNMNDNHLLDRKYIYLDTSGIYNFPKYEDILDGLKQKIKEIQNGNNNMIMNNEENKELPPLFIHH